MKANAKSDARVEAKRRRREMREEDSEYEWALSVEKVPHELLV
jgi:hypothetical protein